jgi:hypothetical protein
MVSVRPSSRRSSPRWCTVFARRSVKPSRELCMTTCARDDGLHILEWIAHRRSIGVERFFIYTNNNTDGSDELLRALVAVGEIRLTENEPFPLDKVFYTRTYPLAAVEIGQGDFVDPWHHYVAAGRFRGYLPVPPCWRSR